MKVAVVGTGISGMLAARLLSAEHEVHVFEAGDYVGGHTNTIDVEAFGGRHRIDTGFMVFNERTYPNFVRLLELLGVESQPSDMSFSVRCQRSGLEYQGSSLNGLFAQRRNLLRPRFHRMLRDILRFNREAPELLAGDDVGPELGEYLDAGGFGREFVEHYLIPMGSAIWSARPDRMRSFPARFFVRFFANHGLLDLKNRPQWLTVRGGARSYVERLIEPYRERIRLHCPVRAVTRHEDHVFVQPADGPGEVFDAVVLASHADQSLRMLTDPDPAEREVLGAFAYQPNEAVVHTDVRLLPRLRRAWASWNYHATGRDDRPAAVTYNLNRLQRLQAPGPILVTLNDTDAIDPRKILRTITYNHPVYSREAVLAQRRHGEFNGARRTYFCGAYWGNGFHEDGVNSALAVGNYFGAILETCIAASTKGASGTGVLAR